ncbi:transglutaminase domain-containing protein [Flavitalea sp. BT771]|uniref:transglutaminase domain-containing protein n=1 Tax=Flavitalea sp. BT771 TaxID=3063329 RepID=UPI0026E29C52|nr:transglutaminase domain-containing protein [Flavitalea sp. BT771]MDO6432045.1 transglutaminase domain-containing protein [Flavitalea sp. BT771]MDV6220954.1 transglutaminase domain-containing protein [Flavitalea sp. BT771]
MISKISLQPLKNLFRNLYFLMFLNGFLIASMFYFRMESTYEEGLFASIKGNIDSRLDANDTQDSIVVKAMATCHELMINRAPIFGGSRLLGPSADFFHGTSVDLMTTQGACGSYSQVMAMILKTYDYPVRIAQMKANGTWAAHNIVEVKTDHGWVVLDPTFNAYWVTPAGRLASFADVRKDWNYYSRQVPANYDMQYRFEDVRYANWTKIPVLMPAAKGILNWVLGKEKADTISVRTWFLKIYSIYFFVTFFLYIPVFLYTFRRLIQTKVFPNPDIPITFGNLIKYMRPFTRQRTEFTR